MYDIEVHILDKVAAERLKSKSQTLEGREAEISYNKKVIRINVIGLWDLAYGDYDTFTDELVGTIIHEYLHYFFHVNEIPQNEKMMHNLANDLLLLSLGHLIGAANEKDEKSIEAYEKWLNARFTQ